MQQERHQHYNPRLKLQELNSHLVCGICKGYLIDANTIVECLHSFCRSCLARHIEKHAACPTCDAPLPKAKPLLHIRSDKTLQDIVYKLVPGLYHDEMKRRRDFYAKHPDEAWRASPEERGTAMERLVFSPQDQFSLSLEYSSKPQNECRNEDWETGSTRSSTSSHEGGSEGATAKRYLQCPALFTIGLLKKFLRSKYELKTRHKVDVFYRRACLPDDYTIQDVAYIYSWRQTSPMRFLYCICDEEKPVAQQLREKKCEMLSAKKRPSVEVSTGASESDQETKTAPKSSPSSDATTELKVETDPKTAPPKQEERIALVVTQNENEHPVISIPSPPPSSESTPELDLLDMIDKNLKEETALANNNNNVEMLVTIKADEMEKSKMPVKTVTPPPPTPPLSLSVSITTTSATTSPAMTSPSKSKIRSPGNGPSILSIASELARKQQEQMERKMSKSSGFSVPMPKIVPIASQPSSIIPSARLGSGKSSLEIKLVPSNAASKQSQPNKMEPSKPQTSITLKSNTDKDKMKLTQPRVSMESVLSVVPHAKQHAVNPLSQLSMPSTSQKPSANLKGPAKRPHQPYKFHNYEESILKASKDDGVKKQKLEVKKPPTSPVKSGAKMYHSSTISPFAPVHKALQLGIATPPVNIQRPASLSSTSSPSPSPPSTELRHYSPPQQPKKSPTIEPPLSPVNNIYNGLLAAAAVARHPNPAAAAALFMRQQFEYQKMYQRPDWAYNPHFMHHSAAANTMKRLSEDYARSLYPFGVSAGPAPTCSSTSTPLSSSGRNSK